MDDTNGTDVYSGNQSFLTNQSPEFQKKFKELEGAAFAEPAFFDILRFPFLKGDPKTALNQANTASAESPAYTAPSANQQRMMRVRSESPNRL